MTKSNAKSRPRRPGAVIVAGWCAILAVPLVLARVTLVLANGQMLATMASTAVNPNSWLSTQGLDTLVYALVAPIALLSLITGIAILQLKRWAWVVLMLFLVLALLLNLARAYYGQPEYFLMLVYALLTLLLNQPDVRHAFRVGRPAHEPVR
ncbi:MAG TPA: hypothetical protein VK449_00985 [Anaerolineales bacterium]|nr:hypothetical protein [Anaerolineales bacterium]